MIRKEDLVNELRKRRDIYVLIGGSVVGCLLSLRSKGRIHYEVATIERELEVTFVKYSLGDEDIVLYLSGELGYNEMELKSYGAGEDIEYAEGYYYLATDDEISNFCEDICI